MHTCRFSSRILAGGLILSLMFVALPAGAEPAEATLSGSIVWTAENLPAAGVKLHASDSQTGRLYTSLPAGDDGSFELSGLPPSIYELAVESEEGLFLVVTPLKLGPGSSRTVNLMVSRLPSDDAGRRLTGEEARPGLANNPLLAVLGLVGVVVVAGLIIDSNSSNGGSVSPAMPPN